jgi:hypothetical protein
VAKKVTRRVKAKKSKAKRAKVQRRVTKKSLKSMAARDAFSGAEETSATEEHSTPVIDIL